MSRPRKSPAWVSSFLCYVLMYLAWSIWHSFIRTEWNLGASQAVWADILVKALIWLLPLLPFLGSREGWLVPPKQIFSTPFPWFACLAMLCVSAAFLHTVRIAAGRLNTFIMWDNMFFIVSVSAGIIEELFFRGFLFNRQAADLGPVPAALLNGMLFMLFHYPFLIIGQGFSLLFSARSLMLFFVGIWFSFSFARWKNIMLLVVVHSIWNVLSYHFALAG